MINGFTLYKHQPDQSFVLNLYLDSVEVASFLFDRIFDIEIEYFKSSNQNYLTLSKHGLVYIPLEWDTSKALYDLLADFPADFSRFEYSRK